ncbi:MAG: alpha-L-fucosidase [Armatimonadetes bacterium CG07_land_8_20_14_0_80_59_28]|nr:MAG: alpha-L-fucosidase [Armatimonadetes bacterium CG07_land_8_20_14_0_80_59_28]
MTEKTNEDPMQWFREARLGMFVHWGIYSVLGHGEQPLYRELLNPSEYAKLADQFRAERFDPHDWTATAKAANMRYMVLTAKHHDGFCLWNTNTTRYNAVERGPKRDLIAEYVRACRKVGLRVGLYYSLPDWSIPAFWSGPENDRKGYRDFIRMGWRQMEELVSNYGRIDLLWFDGSHWPTAQQWRSTQLVKMIRSHQPDIIINDRLPKPKAGGDWGYATPEQRIGGWIDEPWESCITSTRKFWGYHVCHEDPAMWYTDRELLTMFVQCLSSGGNLLWNVGPYANGELPTRYKEQTRRLGDWVRRNRKAIYGTRPARFEFAYGGFQTVKGNRLYLFFLFWPGKEYSLPGFNEKLRSARFVDGGGTVDTVQEPHRIVVKNLPSDAPDPCTVVELTFDAPPTVHEWAACRLHNYPMPPMAEWARL